MIREQKTDASSGFVMAAVLVAAAAASGFGFYRGVASDDVATILGSLLAFMSVVFLLFGLFIVNPNEAKVLQLFGRYMGTVETPGLRWANPLYTKHKVSRRVRNFETGKIKVNDSQGNPIEIAAVVVWKVVDTAEAVFEVDDYVNYVHVQSEAAVRNLASRYAYDSHGDDGESLVGNITGVSERLREENQNRLDKAGVKIIESRISHLAYSPEIAQAMLRRQQASAIIAARSQIVDGAVGMVEHALDELSKKRIVSLDEERKAAMVSNLLVVLCSETATQPVVNTGSLYT